MAVSKSTVNRIAVMGLVFIMVVTGGIFVVDIKDFGGAVPYKLAEGSAADVWLQPQINEVGAPFLMVYSHYGRPYSLNIRNWDGGGKYKSIQVSDVVVTYGDGTVYKPDVSKTGDVLPARHSGYRRGRTLTAVPDAVKIHADNKISMKGWLEKAEGGKKTPFEASLTFTAQQKWGISPYWIALGMRD